MRKKRKASRLKHDEEASPEAQVRRGLAEAAEKNIRGVPQFIGRQLSRAYQLELDTLRALDDPFLNEVIGKIESAQTRISPYYVGDFARFFLGLGAAALVCSVGASYLSIVVTRVASDDRLQITTIGAGLGLACGVLFLGSLTRVLEFLRVRTRPKQIPVRFLAAIAMIGGSSAALINGSLPKFVCVSIAAAALGLIAFALIAGWLAERLDVFMLERQPDEYVVVRLVSVAALSHAPATWTSKSSRHALVHAIEGAARAIERAVWMKSGDPGSDRAIRQMAREAREHIYGLKALVVLPSEVRKAELMRLSRKLLIAAASGRWSEFIPESRPPSTRSVRSWATSAWVRAALPVGIAVATHLVSAILADNPSRYAVIAVGALIALLATARLHPNLVERANSLKGLAELFIRRRP